MEENSLKSVMKLLTNILNIDSELNDEAYLRQFKGIYVVTYTNGKYDAI